MLAFILESIGLFWVATQVYQLILALIHLKKGDTDIQLKYGKDCWAVVTGATDGMGKSFCEELTK
jgi:17beta-estradiol 17-dehydrogenase / very-long-chain 3-oxoacyl-CoA reductase